MDYPYVKQSYLVAENTQDTVQLFLASVWMRLHKTPGVFKTLEQSSLSRKPLVSSAPRLTLQNDILVLKTNQINSSKSI